MFISLNKLGIKNEVSAQNKIKQEVQIKLLQFFSEYVC